MALHNLNSAAIELCKVSKSYRMGGSVVDALNSVSLTVEAGDFVAITGRSGSGKSTLLNLMGCLDRPDSGELFIAGAAIHSANVDELAAIRNERIGFVFQHFHLLPDHTALENVMLPLQYAAVAPVEQHELAMQALAELGLERWADHRPAQLSGGQQQRVAIARAVVRRPTLLLADEPTGALDRTTATEVLAQLVRLGVLGITVIMVTHDIELAEKARRRVQMIDGKIAGDSHP